MAIDVRDILRRWCEDLIEEQAPLMQEYVDRDEHPIVVSIVHFGDRVAIHGMHGEITEEESAELQQAVISSALGALMMERPTEFKRTNIVDVEEAGD